MKLKTLEIEGKTYAEVENGMPVYTHDDGQEKPFDAPHTVQTLVNTQAEAKNHRLNMEEAQGKLEGFSRIEDVDAALSALETVKNLDDKKLVDAGEIDKVKTQAVEEAIKATEAKYLPFVEKSEKLEKNIDDMILDNAFANSAFIREKVTLPYDFLKPRLSSNFKIVDGKPIGLDAAGQEIYSKERPGEHADFEEAVSIIIENHPAKEQIVKGTDQKGSDLRPSDLKPGQQQAGKIQPGNISEAAKSISQRFGLPES